MAVSVELAEQYGFKFKTFSNFNIDLSGYSFVSYDFALKLTSVESTPFEKSPFVESMESSPQEDPAHQLGFIIIMRAAY